jgi:apolipoprotein N-acyltransferase
MTALAHRIILAWGWERRLIAMIAGAIGALAMPPVDFFPALAIPMTVAVWLIDGSQRAGEGTRSSKRAFLLTAREAAAAGWWLGFGYFVAGLWWLGAAFLVEPDRFAWLLPLGVIGLPCLLAFFTAAGFALASLLWSSGAARILALAAGLGFAEWLRGNVLTGFPWNSFGMALGGNLVLAQFSCCVGLYGSTIIAIAIFAAPATLIDTGRTGRSWTTTPSFLAVAALLALAAFGTLRLAAGKVEFVPNVKLRIMQPNLPQDAKFRPENGEAILQHYLDLSDRATSPQTSGIGDVTHLIWPESAFPFILSREPGALAEIGQFLRPGTVLVTGAARTSEPLPSEATGRTRVHYFNSVQVIASGGVILASYDKVHLVPFGEYLPMGALLERLGLQNFVHIPGGFDAGIRRELLAVPGLPPVAPLICYEAIFPGEVTPTDGSSTRPGVLLNVTNDGWFGMTPGPYQHLAQARLRAIEEGLPLVRAANTGISAIVDPYGRILSQLPLGREDVLDGRLPQGIGPTLFARAPIMSVLAIWLVAIAGSVLLRRRL